MFRVVTVQARLASSQVLFVSILLSARSSVGTALCDMVRQVHAYIRMILMRTNALEQKKRAGPGRVLPSVDAEIFSRRPGLSNTCAAHHLRALVEGNCECSLEDASGRSAGFEQCTKRAGLSHEESAIRQVRSPEAAAARGRAPGLLFRLPYGLGRVGEKISRGFISDPAWLP